MGQAIDALAAFARQRSGIEFGNYGEIKSFRAEQRSITKDLHDFRRALREAELAHVTDEEVIEASKRAFSGRLEWGRNCLQCGRTFQSSDPYQHWCSIEHAHAWNSVHPDEKQENKGGPDSWHYCTGQYFPTEYRKAATAVLKQALNDNRRKWAEAHPTTSNKIQTIAELKALHQANAGHWFDKDTMRFFNSRIESGIIGGKYFISSEKNDGAFGSTTHPRLYTIRTFDEQGNIDEVGGFQAHKTKAEARAAIQDLLKSKAA